jgi:hypothetical protein
MRGMNSHLHYLYDQFKPRGVEFITVYILEAHAQDQWPISSARFTPDGNPIIYNQPKTNEERLTVAKDFVNAFNFRIPIVIDDITNPFEEVYACWPLRFYIIKDGILVYKAQPKNCTYDLGELYDHIVKHCPNQEGLGDDNVEIKEN